MADTAVIFDVDGVLLDLTPEEEDAFFWPFARLHGLEGLSRDWDSYLIRNDDDIIAPEASRRRADLQSSPGYAETHRRRTSPLSRGARSGKVDTGFPSDRAPL